MSCCFSPAVRWCFSKPHQSQTSVSVQHGQLTPSPSFSMILLSLYPLSPSPVTRESLSDLCLSEKHPSLLRREERREGILPDKSNDEVHTHADIYTHQFPLYGPEWVVEGEGLVVQPLLRLAASLTLFPLGTCKHKKIYNRHECLEFSVFHIFNFDFRTSLDLQPMVKSFQDSLLTTKVEYSGGDYHIISI